MLGTQLELAVVVILLAQQTIHGHTLIEMVELRHHVQPLPILVEVTKTLNMTPMFKNVNAQLEFVYFLLYFKLA